jgi:hypothetical protein
MVNAGAMMMHRSGKVAFTREYARQQKEFEQRAIKEFIARHGG